MDWNIFWNAFGAIGTSFGSITMAITVWVAYRQYSLSKKSKLRIHSTLQRITTEEKGTQIFLQFDFINCGIIDLEIREISIRMHNKNYRVENYFEINQGVINNREFSINVTNRCMVSARIHIATIKHLIKEVINPNININKNVKLKFVFVDGKGKIYKKSIKIN